MKYLVTVVLFLFLVIPSFSKIKEFPSDKVLVDTNSGTIIHTPRNIDYDYHKALKKIKYEKRPSLKETIFGRKGCSN